MAFSPIAKHSRGSELNEGDKTSELAVGMVLVLQSSRLVESAESGPLVRCAERWSAVWLSLTRVDGAQPDSKSIVRSKLS